MLVYGVMTHKKLFSDEKFKRKEIKIEKTLCVLLSFVVFCLKMYMM